MTSINGIDRGIFPYNSTIIFMDNTSKEASDNNKKSKSLKSLKLLEKLSVILADDDVDDRDFFREAVEGNLLNIKLNFAEDGKSLTDMLNGTHATPDIIFLDLNMPHKSGLECLIEIRKSMRLKNIPIIIYSTSSSQKDIDDTYKNGANLYVKKPSSFKELKNIISEVLFLDWKIYKPLSSRQQFVFSLKTA